MPDDFSPDEWEVPCEVYSRIVGYIRPTQDWHKAKQQEFADRVPFKLSTRVLTGDDDGESPE